MSTAIGAAAAAGHAGMGASAAVGECDLCLGEFLGASLLATEVREPTAASDVEGGLLSAVSVTTPNACFEAKPSKPSAAGQGYEEGADEGEELSLSMFVG